MTLSKYIKIAVLGAMCIGLLGGCASTNNENSSEATSSVSEETGKTLKIAFPDMVTTTDPANVSSATMLKEVAGVCETLVYADSDFTLQPMLAESWQQTGDLTWEFKLREDVLFHDGTKLNAEAVKWCLERESDENSAFKGSTFIDSVDVVDEYTININTTQPTTELPAALSYVGTAIVAPSSVDESGSFIKAVGTGYFMQTDFDESSGKFICEKFDDYWGDVTTSVTKRVVIPMTDASARSLAVQNGEVDIASDIPFSDLEMLSSSDTVNVSKSKRVVIPMTDASARSLAVQNGEVDIASDIPFSDLEMLSSSDTVNVSKFNTARTYYYEYNLDGEVLQDENVRKALIYAINKEEIVNDVLLGVGGVPKGMLMEEIPWANTDVDTYD